MDAIATINVRMPESLKGHGSQVLKRNGVSPSELVRSAYRYLEQEQRIPECLDVASPSNDVFTRRRKLLRTLDFGIQPPEGIDLADLRAERIEKKYGGLL